MAEQTIFTVGVQVIFGGWPQKEFLGRMRWKIGNNSGEKGSRFLLSLAKKTSL